MTASKQPSRRFQRYFTRHLPVCVTILASVLLEMSFYSGLPFSFRFIVDDGLLAHNQRLLFQLIGALGAGAVIVALASFLRDRLYARLTATVLTELRAEMFDHLQLLSMNFFGAQPMGDILARFSTDLAAVESATGAAIAWALLPSLDVLAGVALLFVLDWRLAMMALLVFPLAITGPRFFAPRVAEESYRRKGEESNVLSFLQENLSAQILVKTFGLADYSRRGFLHRLDGLRERMVRVGTFSGLVERSSYVGIMLLQVAILAAGAYMVSAGQLSVGALASFQALFLSLSYSLANVMQFVPVLVEASGSMRRVGELLAHQPLVRDTGSTPLGRFAREIRFEGVGFGYAAGQRNLQALSVSIPVGEYVAVVGSSGSGKSTILGLLMRLYDPGEGRITMDGVDLKDAPLSDLRTQIGYVPQESFLFNISIRENIRLGNLQATQEEIEEATRAAEVHDFIAQLPEGYDTLAGERGGRLSGGQRQRVALARALLRNPSILILDEATSALDPGTEAAILNTLERLRAHRTILSVTHRLNSVTSADRILVMDHGSLAEQGSHTQLLAKDGAYRRMWEKQSGFTLDQTRHQAEISLERLRQVGAFYGMSDQVLAETRTLLRTEEYPAGHAVNRQGDYGASLYVIVRGSVELLVEKTAGDVRRVAVLQEGDAFGESSLLESEPESETVRAIEPCVFLTLNRAKFLYLRQRDPE
jgi:ATP-binding cassette subfamily B protein